MTRLVNRVLVLKFLFFPVVASFVPSGRAQVMTVPANAVERAGTLTNAGKISLPSAATSNVVFTLQSADSNSVAVPDSVTILSSQTNVLFDLFIGDNLVVDGDRVVTVMAANPSFQLLTNVILVRDNDPHHLRFGAVPYVTDTNSGVGLLLRAENADGSLQTNFNSAVTMIAEGIEGPLPVSPTNSGAFAQGQLYTSFQVLAPGHAVRLRTAEYPGQSEPFNVIPPAFSSISQPVADIIWHSASQTLLASVPPSGGIYSNCLVAIDPATGTVTNSYPVGFDPSQIEISPAGTYLYIALSNHAALQRFDLNTRTAGLKFALGTNTNPVRFAYDYCVPPGLSDSVVVEARDRDSIGNTSRVGIYRYNSGVGVALANFFATGGWLLESLDTAFDVVMSPPLVRGNASTGSILATAANFPGTSVVYRGGQLFDERGNFYAPGNLALLGTYPAVLEQSYYTSLPEVDPGLRRVFYLSGYFNYGVTFYNLKIYDRDLLQPLLQLPIPTATGSPARFLRCGSNLLAYVTGNNQLWFVRPEATQPPGSAVDLAISYSSIPSPAIQGSNFTFTITLSNAGPGIASLVRVTNAAPANTTILQTSASTGSVTVVNSSFTWSLGNLAPGSNQTLQVVLRFGTAGWQTNSTWALGFEPDPIFTNNSLSLPVYVQLSPDAIGVFAVNGASEDLVYDPVRDRLLVSVGNSGTTQSNGIAVLNPYTGVTESFTPLGKRPTKLARSSDGQFLYVSLPDDALLRRLTLSNLTQLEFTLGGEYINGTWYPFYANDFAVVPTDPQSLVAWRVRRAGPLAGEYGWGIALFKNGVMATNVTDAGGGWTVEFDTDSGTLFGYNSGDLRRCSVNSNGVSFVEQAPAIYNAGGDIEYAAGLLFTSAGRLEQYQPFRAAWVFTGSENAALVEPDATSSRVFYLAQNGSWQLNAYDIPSRRLLGSIAVPNVAGTPTSLIRWGTNGLAFRTPNNQIYLIRSLLVQPSVAADVAVAMTGPLGPVLVGSNADFTISATNRGPNLATGVQISNTASTSTAFFSVSASVGNWTTNATSLTWTIPSLSTNTQATLSYTIVPTSVGTRSINAVATATTLDTAPENNAALRFLVAGPPLALDGVMKLPFLANDMVWSASLGNLLLSSSLNNLDWGGSVISIDPVSFDIQWRAALGSDAGRLAIARDEGLLYGAVDAGGAILPLPSLTVTNRFLINAGMYGYDLKVAPGSNQVVAVGGHSRTDNTTVITVFENGVQRANADSFYGTGVSLEFGNDPQLFYCQDFALSGFRRYTNNSAGVSLIDSTTSLLPTSTAQDILWGNEKLYSSIGKVVNPSNRTVIATLAGIAAGSKVRYDAGSDRVFFLSPGGTLSAFDGPTLLPVGTRTISGITGSLRSFVRWGVDGFAALTDTGQVVLFRSSLLATNPPADVSLLLSQSAPPYFPGSNITTTLNITNAGPNTATDVAWNNTLPTGTTILNATNSAGTVSISSNIASGVIPTLAVGSAATVNVTFARATPGILTNQASVIASSQDPAFGNNSAALLLWVQATNGLPATIALNLAVKDVERDPVRPLLYASFDSSAGPLADSVVIIDPVNGGISAPTRVGSGPGRMAASPDGQFLYVALDGSGTIQQLALPGLVPISSFAVPQNQTVLNMAVSPTNSQMVVLRRSPAGKTSLLIGGAQMPGELTSQDLFAFSSTSGQLYGCDGAHSNVRLYHLNTASNGLTLLESQPGKQSSSSDLRSSGGYLLFNRGMIVNPDTARVVGILPVPLNSVGEPDAGSGRAFFLTGSGTAWTLRAYDMTQGVEVGAVSLPSLSSAPRRLQRWGTDGLVFYNTTAQVVILRGQLVPTNPAVDVVLSQSFNARTATTNDLLTVSVGVTNLGPGAVSGVVVTQSFSLTITNVILSPSQGIATYANGTITWLAGSLAQGGTGSVTLTFRATQAGTLTVSAAANHNLNDAFWGNNSAVSVANILNTGSTNVLQVRLATRDLVYDAARDVIYATTPASNRLSGDLVVVIDPTTGEIKNAMPAGSEPNLLTMSDDNRFLYASLDGATGVQRLDLQTHLPDLSFPLGTNDIYYALDLEAQPGHPQTVVASLNSYNFAFGFPSDVTIYDAGVMRTNRGGPARGIAFSSDGACVFGCVSPGGGTPLMRMWPVTNGFQTESVAAFTSTPTDLKFCNGRIYTDVGQVAEPYTPTLLRTFSASGPQAIDASAGRAYYLVQAGAGWEIRAFDLATFQAVGTQTVANVQGTPGSLIRCGADRLAFRTSSSQLFIVHTQIAATNSLTTANLAVSQQVAQDFNAWVETLRFAITVTNSGPGTASNVLVAIKPPAVAASTSIQVTQGTTSISNGNYLCNLGSLSAGQSLAVLLSAVITNTAVYSNLVSVTAAAPDPDLSDNRSSIGVQGMFFQRPDTSLIYPAAVGALAYDPVRQRLLAALPTTGGSNQIAWYDPESAARQGSFSVDLVPTLMVITEDSQFLYLCGSTGLVQRIALSSLTSDLSFTPAGSVSTAAMATVPGNPHSIALTYWIGGNPVTAIFDDSVARPDQVNGWPFTLLGASTDASAIYGFANTGTGGNSPDVFRMAVSGSGLQMVDNGPSDVPGGVQYQMYYKSNRLLFSSGSVLNTAPWTAETNFALPYFGLGVQLVPSINGAAFLSGDFNSAFIAHVTLNTITNRTLLTQIDMRPNSTGFGNLTYCGADRFAFRSSSELIFVRSSVVPSADIAVHCSVSTNRIMAGDPLTIQVLVSNAGPYAVTNVIVTNNLAAPFTILSASLSKGSIATNGQSLIGLVGSLGTNATATLNVVLVVSNTSSNVWLTNTADALATDRSDPIPFNNHATLPILVLPRDSDHDGIPDDWEIAHGLNPNDPSDAALDSDCDGKTNLQEYQAGTDPLQFDGLRIASLSVAPNGVCDLTIRAEVGKMYNLESSSNLLSWSSALAFVCETTDQRVSLPQFASAAYYRLRTSTNAPVPLLAITRSLLPTNNILLEIKARPGHGYALQSSSNLTDWSDVTNFYATACSTLLPTDQFLPFASSRFYRVRVP